MDLIKSNQKQRKEETMKKIMTLTIAVATSIAAYANPRKDTSVEKATVWAENPSAPLESALVWRNIHLVAKDSRDEIDEIVSKKVTETNSATFLDNAGIDWNIMIRFAPKTAAAIAAAQGCLTYAAVISGDRTVPDKISSGVDYISYRCEQTRFFNVDIRNLAKDIQSVCIYAVRRRLRANGISFVAKKGHDPQREYMQRIADCLNAPRFGGLEQALTEIGLGGAHISAIAWIMPDEAVDELKEKILVGEVPFNNKHAVQLRFNLGVTEYNKFVREYNGD